MNLWQGIKVALGAIMANKLRSFLTMLGVIIGVAAVITLVSLGQGATSQVSRQIQGMGSNLITVSVIGRGANSGLTYEQTTELADLVGVAGVAPVVSGLVTVKHGTRSYETSLEGSNQDYAQVRNIEVEQGRFVLPLDLEFRQKVVLLGSDVVKEIFGLVDPLGETVQINGLNFKVVGLLKSQGSTGSGVTSNDDRVIIPLTTAQRLLRNVAIRQVFVQAAAPEMVNTAMDSLDTRLQRFFRDENAFRLMSQTAMLETVSQVTGTMTLMLGGIAGISLLVGGIGIMNIMLVTVTERTREIGIRKALGARRRDILMQFLIESIVLSGMGGLLGVAAGVGGSRALQQMAGMNTALSMEMALLAFGFAAFVGIFFGLYPANKAASMNPIEALRYE